MKKSSSKCRSLVSAKIRKVYEEGVRGKPVEQPQAVAVGMSMTRKAHPECASVIGKGKKSKKKKG